MKLNEKQKCNTVALVKASQSTFHINAWIRNFLSSKYRLVGKTFTMRNLCVCVDAVMNLASPLDDPVVYKITDSDVSIRAIFSKKSIEMANDSLLYKTSEFSPSMLSRSPLLLEQCRLVHILVPGTPYGDFALEVQSFIWECDKFTDRKVEEVLYLAPQYIWCCDDPEIQELVKEVFNLRGKAVYGYLTVTNHMNLILDQLSLSNTLEGSLYIPPETVEKFHLDAPGTYRSSLEAPNQVISEDSDCQIIFEKSNHLPSKARIPLNSCHSSTSAVLKQKEILPSSKVSFCTSSLPSPRTNGTNNSTHQGQIVSTSVCRSFFPMEPNIILKCLSPSEIASYQHGEDNFENKVSPKGQSKHVFPRWVPKTMKVKSVSPKRPSVPKTVKEKSVSPTTPSVIKKTPKKSPEVVPPTTDKPPNEQLEPAFDTILQTVLTESQISLPVSDSLQVLTSQDTLSDKANKKEHKDRFGSIYQDAFSKWLENSTPEGFSDLSTPVGRNVKRKRKHTDMRSKILRNGIIMHVPSTSLKCPNDANTYDLFKRIENSPYPKLILSQLPSDLATQRELTSATERTDVNLYKDIETASTSSSDVEIVYSSDKLSSGSSLKSSKSRRSKSDSSTSSQIALQPETHSLNCTNRNEPNCICTSPSFISGSRTGHPKSTSKQPPCLPQLPSPQPVITSKSPGDAKKNLQEPHDETASVMNEDSRQVTTEVIQNLSEEMKQSSSEHPEPLVTKETHVKTTKASPLNKRSHNGLSTSSDENYILPVTMHEEASLSNSPCRNEDKDMSDSGADEAPKVIGEHSHPVTELPHALHCNVPNSSWKYSDTQIFSAWVKVRDTCSSISVSTSL